MIKEFWDGFVQGFKETPRLMLQMPRDIKNFALLTWSYIKRIVQRLGK